jgi:smad nuclear-interacting protein 1
MSHLRDYRERRDDERDRDERDRDRRPPPPPSSASSSSRHDHREREPREHARRPGDERRGGWGGREARDREAREREEEQARTLQWGRPSDASAASSSRDRAAAHAQAQAPPPEQPNFAVTGLLTKGMNVVNGVEVAYVPPLDAKEPSVRWRLYVFRGKEAIDEPIRLYGRAHFLFGRDRVVVDVPTDHPSCSKQHAVVQYRMTEQRTDAEFTGVRRTVKPYLFDLGSTNGTFLNSERVEPRRYIELREGDVLKFGESSRDYVLLHPDSMKTLGGAKDDNDEPAAQPE